jgi:mannose-6-phosphate isomerase-like protein (cupin superfamily)
MKVIRMEEIKGVLPSGHYDLDLKRVIGESDSTTGLRVSFVLMQENGKADPHVHEEAEQLFMVLKGEMMFTIEGVEISVKAGSAILVQPGESHENYNASQGETEYLVITSYPR